MQGLSSGHTATIVLALAAFVIWTLGTRLKRKLFVYIGIALCILAVLVYMDLFPFLSR